MAPAVSTTSREDAQEPTGDAAVADTTREDAASSRTERRAEREASRAEDRADDAGRRAERSGDAGEELEGRAEQAAQKAYSELAGLGAGGEGEAPVRAVELLGRVGLVGYGLVHVLIGAIAVHVAWSGGGQPDQQGALAGLIGSGLGIAVLAVMVVGLVAFAVWQGLAAAAGFRWTSGMTRVRKRVGAGAKTVAVLAVAVVGGPAAGHRLVGRFQLPGSERVTAGLLALPAGWIVVGLVGVVVVVVAVIMGYTDGTADGPITAVCSERYRLSFGVAM